MLTQGFPDDEDGRYSALLLLARALVPPVSLFLWPRNLIECLRDINLNSGISAHAVSVVVDGLTGALE